MSADDLQVLLPFAEILSVQDSNSCYILGESLGKGSFGRVWHVVRRSDQMHFVAKLIELHRMDANAALRARSEVGCLAACSHFACVGFIEDYNVDNNLLIIMEYCDAGDLHYQLKTMRSQNNGVAKGFKERDARLILVQIVLALNHMHRRKMLHRDIKAANVLLSTAGLVKIGDFGLSREYTTNTIDANIAQTFCGTADYLAPEVWRREKYGARADVWSLGILTYECLVGRRPFVGENLRDKILNEEVVLPEDITADLSDIMVGMLKKNPAERMSIRELLQSRCLAEALASFADTVSRTRRLSEDQRAFVQAGIQEAFNVTPSTTASPVAMNPSFEGPVAKLKEGRFIDRYLILRDGFIGIFRDRQSCENVTLSARNARPVQYIVQVTRVPVTRGSNLLDNVFMIDFGGDGDQNNCVWLRSENCDEWIKQLRSAMRM